VSRRRKILIVVGAALAAVVLIPVIRHYQLKAAVNRYRAELKAKGEPMELAQVIPPTLTPEQNSAAFFLKAASLLDTNWNVLGSNPPPAMRMVAPGKAMIGWQQPDVRESGKNGPTNSWLEIDCVLTLEKNALDTLRQLPEHSQFDFKIDYSAGFSKMKYSSLVPAKKAAQRLSASAINGLRRNDTDTAARDIEAMLAVANGISHDRILISELVRIAIAQISVAASWEFLQSTNITDGQLAALQHTWSCLEFIQAFENSITTERAVGTIELAEMRSSGLQHYLDLSGKAGLFDTEASLLSGFKVKYKATMWRFWWSYPDELRYLQGMQVLLEPMRQTRTNYTLLAVDIEARNRMKKLPFMSDKDDGFWFTDPTKADFHFIISSSMPAFESAFNKVMRVEAARQTIVTAIALKRYQLKYGKYPTDLDLLAPEFVPTVPLDPVDGQPLRYRLNFDGTFLLYSIGENGEDDGGDPSLQKNIQSSNFYWQNPRALDWVWPQPASPEEVQKYYDEQAGKSK
jgi:hypothetical protein